MTDAVFELLNVGASVVDMRADLAIQRSIQRPRSEAFLDDDCEAGSGAGIPGLSFDGRYPEAQQQVAAWLHEGKLKFHETVYEGLKRVCFYRGVYRLVPRKQREFWGRRLLGFE